MKIAVHGCGYVGGAHCHYFENQDVELLKYDPGKGFFDDVGGADVHFVAVPTPYLDDEGGFSLSFVEEAIKHITDKQPEGAVIVIKSTVLPGTTKQLQEKHPQHTFLFSPEFLKKRSANEDFLNPERTIVGYIDDKGKGQAEKILNILPQAPKNQIIGATEAELIKYFSNTFLATKVVFSNMMYDMCEKLGLDYDQVKEGVSTDSRIGTTHLDIFQDGGRGYGGGCFPKDIRALIQLGEELEVDVSLLKETERRNNELQNGQ